MYFSKKLNEFNKIKHCFFSKNGGISKNIYSSLNCGLGSKDEKNNVLGNLAIVTKKIGRNEPCPCGSGKKYKTCHGN